MSCSFSSNSFRDVSSIRSCWLTSVFTCIGLYNPTRIICPIPRESLRSLLFTCWALSTAFIWRVSTHHHWQRRLRHWPCLQPNLGVFKSGGLQQGNDRLRLRRYLGLSRDFPGLIDNADRCFLDRNIQPSTILHGSPSSVGLSRPAYPDLLSNVSVKDCHLCLQLTRRNRRDTPSEQGAGAWSKGIEISPARDGV